MSRGSSLQGRIRGQGILGFRNAYGQLKGGDGGRGTGDGITNYNRGREEMGNAGWLMLFDLNVIGPETR